MAVLMADITQAQALATLYPIQVPPSLHLHPSTIPRCDPLISPTTIPSVRISFYNMAPVSLQLGKPGCVGAARRGMARWAAPGRAGLLGVAAAGTCRLRARALARRGPGCGPPRLAPRHGTHLARGCAAGARRLDRCEDGQAALCAGAMHACVMRTCARRARVACACCVCPCCVCPRSLCVCLLRVPLLCVSVLCAFVLGMCLCSSRLDRAHFARQRR